jgi:hypothetical protein
MQNAIVRQVAVTILASPNGVTPPPTSASVSCASDERATGGGFSSGSGSPLVATENRPLVDTATNRPTGWAVTVFNAFNQSTTAQGTIYAVCVPIP